MEYKFAAGITWYNPSSDNIRQTLQYTKDFLYVFIYDNSMYQNDYKEKFLNYKNLIYISRPNNDGLPMAFNSIIEKCKEYDIDFLCTLDQDSKLHGIDIKRLKKLCVDNKDKKVAIVAPTPVDFGKRSKINNYFSKLNNVSWVICSGSFLNLKLLEKMQVLYDEKYFIDRFDADFSMQIKKRKMNILRDSNILIEHACGDSNHRHSPLRNYYLFRNRYYYNRKYYKSIDRYIRNFLQTARQLLDIIFFNDEKIKKLKAFIVGTLDYLHGNMGKISEKSLKKLK